jgi:sugar lactone lactonase YvrE
LGEGPYFEAENDALRFVDLVKKQIHTVKPREGAESHTILADLDISVGVTADIEGDPNRIAFAGKEGYGIFDRRNGGYTWIKKFWNDDEIAEEKPHR